MPHRRPACVVFDLDGVIADSEPLHELANARYLSQLGIQLEESVAASMMGRRVRDLTDAIASAAGIPPEEAFAGRETVFAELLADGVRPMPGLRSALDRLGDAGMRLAVASSGIRSYVERVLASLAVLDRFEVVVCGDDVTAGKPDPEIYALAAHRLGGEAPRCAAVEDAPNGVRSAAGAGMYVVAVPHALTQGGDFSAADVILPDLAAVADHLLAPA